MSAHLLALSIGPVQGFIAAARRTRDLWYGSELLSNISAAAAEAVDSAGGVLIFPPPDFDAGSSVANIVLAEVPSNAPPPERLAAAARAAADAEWKRVAAAAFQDAQAIVDKARWDNQVDDVIEFHAAWVPLGSDAEYPSARKRVMRLLAGRKACRDFTQPTGEAGLPKSSLDGARDTVFRDHDRDELSGVSPELRLRLRRRPGEQLDAVGLVKRLGGDPQGYPSVSRIAADPWLRGLRIAADADEELKAKLAAFTGVCAFLAKHHHLTPLPPDRYPVFPFEGVAVYATRHKEMGKETGLADDQRKDLARKLLALTKVLGEPEPYLAVLVADGDRMGEAISKLGTVEANQDFSRHLAGFAGCARTIVQEHHGCLVYAGGDDVLAFLPVDQCLECARKLHDEFGKQVPHGVTLSVGLAIGHFMDPLEDLLEFARAAERSAKRPDRNGLALHLHPRSGAPTFVRDQWSSGPDARLLTWAAQHRAGSIPDKAAFDLRDLARVYQGWPDNAATRGVIRHDLKRLLSRKRPESQALDVEALQTEIDRCLSETGDPANSPPGHAGIIRLADELIIARRLARTKDQAEGKPTLTEGVPA